MFKGTFKHHLALLVPELQQVRLVSTIALLSDAIHDFDDNRAVQVCLVVVAAGYDFVELVERDAEFEGVQHLFGSRKLVVLQTIFGMNRFDLIHVSILVGLHNATLQHGALQFVLTFTGGTETQPAHLQFNFLLLNHTIIVCIGLFIQRSDSDL